MKKWILMVLVTLLAGSCSKDKIKIEKDYEGVALDVNFTSVDLDGFPLSGAISTENGWVSFSRDQSTYFHVLDTNGKELTSRFAPYNPNKFEKEYLLPEGGGNYFRCIQNPNNLKQILIQRLDPDMLVVDEWMVYESPYDIRLTGFEKDGQTKLVFSLQTSAFASVPALLVFDWFVEQTYTLFENENGLRIKAFSRSEQGSFSFLVYNLDGTGAQLLSFDKNDKLVFSFKIPWFASNYNIHGNKREALIIGRRDRYVYYTISNGMAMFKINERGELTDWPFKIDQSGNMEIYDFAADQNAAVWVLYRESGGWPTGNLLLGRLIPSRSHLADNRMLLGTNILNDEANAFLRLRDGKNWSILLGGKEDQTYKTVLIKP